MGTRPCFSAVKWQAVSLLLCLFAFNTRLKADIPPFADRLCSISDLLNDDPLGDIASLNVPLKRAGRLFLIEAKVDDQTGNFVFDTGATGLVLNSTYFRKYTNYEKSAAAGSIVGTSSAIKRIVISQIEIGALKYKNIEADLADLGHIENRRGVKILGLFGLNMIDNFEVIFDARNNQLQLYLVDKEGNRIDRKKSDQEFDYTQKLDLHKKIMLLQGQVGDKQLNFCLDTGAETNVIDSQLPKKVLNTIKINRSSNLQGANAGNVEVLYGTMSELKLGEKQLGQMETIVTSLERMSEAYDCTIDGMLGYDFWRKGIFCINFGKGTISFSLWKGENQ
ncbi:MAG TPA: retroviral-like aspartic protease family protein [Bacteroidales bacterium]|nr:retroviral-like aspartic protease family protein [Bacteroidales bacterium]